MNKFKVWKFTQSTIILVLNLLGGTSIQKWVLQSTQSLYKHTHNVGGIPEFPGQLIASLLVAQWLGCWCTSLVAQVRFLACPVQRQLLQGVKPKMMLLPPHFRVLHAYVLTCLQDTWPGIVIKGFEPATFGSVSWSEATEGQWLEVPRNFGAN